MQPAFSFTDAMRSVLEAMPESERDKMRKVLTEGKKKKAEAAHLLRIFEAIWKQSPATTKDGKTV